MKKVAYYADHTDIHRHLASEELILNELAGEIVVLYLWSADKSMVIGKNQNPWLECNLSLMNRDACKLARRISGGGAVYHDTGNLNYSVFMPKDLYDRDAISRMILNALKSIGIEGNVGDRHLLEVKGKKFSGNAFCIRREKVLHHGTLLVNANLENLVNYAQPTCAGIEAKGIRSVPSVVGNLSDHADITCASLMSAIFTEFGASDPAILFDHVMLDERTAHFESEAWCFHRTPRFTARGMLPDNVSFQAEVVKGHIKTIDLSPIGPEPCCSYLGMDFREFLKHRPVLALE